MTRGEKNSGEKKIDAINKSGSNTLSEIYSIKIAQTLNKVVETLRQLYRLREHLKCGKLTVLFQFNVRVFPLSFTLDAFFRSPSQNTRNIGQALKIASEKPFALARSLELFGQTRFTSLIGGRARVPRRTTGPATSR